MSAFANRAPAPRGPLMTHMVAYQEMPLTRAKASNREQAKIIAEQKDLPAGQKIAKAPPKPAKVKVVKPKPVKVVAPKEPKERKPRVRNRVKKNIPPGPPKGFKPTKAIEAAHAALLARRAEEIDDLFKDGPITTEEMAERNHYAHRSAANTRLNGWAKLGLVRVCGKKYPAERTHNARPAKLWEKVPK